MSLFIFCFIFWPIIIGYFENWLLILILLIFYEFLDIDVLVGIYFNILLSRDHVTYFDWWSHFFQLLRILRE